jgi:hypothetical protein
MTIEHRGSASDGSAIVVCTACPMCEEPLKDQVGLADHLRNSCPEVE